MTPPDPASPRPAATVVLLRDAGALEVLVVRRSQHVAVAAGALAFPGGSIDQADRAEGRVGPRVSRPAAAAAARECREEVGLDIPTDQLRFLSRWVTPAHMPDRFDAQFFLCPADGDPRPDGEEVVEAFWNRPRTLLSDIDGGEPALPPTVRTLEWLAGFANSRDALRAADRLYEPQVVAPGVVRIRAPNAGVMTLSGTNSYLVGSQELVLIDPGPAYEDHIEALVREAAGRLRIVTTTHHHGDHREAVGKIASMTGATVVEAASLRDGHLMPSTDIQLRAVSTPGHTADHHCFLLEEQGLLFSGDLIIEGSTVAVQPPDGDMSDYIASLQLIRRLGPALIAPGHGEIIEDPRVVVAEYLGHRTEREEQIVAELVHAPSTAAELASKIYYGCWPVLLWPATSTTWAHLRKLGAEGRVRCDDPDDPASVWATSD